MSNKNNENITIVDQEHKKDLKIMRLNKGFLELCERNANNTSSFLHLIDRYKSKIKNIETKKAEEMDFSNEEYDINEDFFYSDFSVDNSVITNHMESDLVDDVNYHEGSDNDLTSSQKVYNFDVNIANCFDFTKQIKNQNTEKMFSPEKGSRSLLYNKSACIPLGLKFEDQFNLMEEDLQKQDSDHRCVDSEIYKFLVRFYGVECPKYNRHNKKSKIQKRKIEPYDWPFKVAPTKPRSVFDTGPTREEVGEYNRRIFDIVTQKTFQFPRTITYRFNPNFYDDDSDEETLKKKEQIYKSDVELYIYDGDVYVYNDLVTLRIYKDDTELHLSLRNSNGDVDIDSEIGCFKMLPDEEGVNIDILYLLNYTIYRLLFRTKTEVERILSHVG
ncbi:hypothetical protein NGRA_2099 [Nosema granulosis]|uniref:Uncharacterized protein n=1 Tax=Nosema granulosis TaxID=83296 RepID=A0A9P6GX75_9MICR|nr:hypothetical protein NGRA_2099 [Nosema granulosis]